MRDRYLVIVGGVTINVLATTCPRCGRGTGEFCAHLARLERAIRERIVVEADRAERERLSTLLTEMTRNRAALAASGEWDMAIVAQGTTKMPTWRQSLRNPHHTSGGGL